MVDRDLKIDVFLPAFRVECIGDAKRGELLKALVRNQGNTGFLASECQILFCRRPSERIAMDPSK